MNQLQKREKNLGLVTYTKHVALSPWNAPILTLFTVIGLISGSLPILLVTIVGELLALGLLPRIRSFRQAVNEKIAEEDSERAEARRVMRACRMSKEQAEKLEKISQLIRKIGLSVSRKQEDGVAVAVDISSWSDQIVDLYIDLSLTLGDLEECASLHNSFHLDESIKTLTERCDQAASSPLTPIRQQLDTLRKRKEQYEKNRMLHKEIAFRLNMIEQSVKLAYEQLCGHIDKSQFDERLEQCLDNLGQSMVFTELD